MQDKDQIREELEALREKLNEKMLNTDTRMPEPETMELSRKMDELLNKLNEITKE